MFKFICRLDNIPECLSRQTKNNSIYHPFFFLDQFTERTLNMGIWSGELPELSIQFQNISSKVVVFWGGIYSIYERSISLLFIIVGCSSGGRPCRPAVVFPKYRGWRCREPDMPALVLIKEGRHFSTVSPVLFFITSW